MHKDEYILFTFHIHLCMDMEVDLRPVGIRFELDQAQKLLIHNKHFQ